MELKEVFEPVFNIVKNFQKKDKEPASKQAAKDRLKLVLMQDRASVSPDFFDMMKKELIDVIKKYIEIDEESLDVQLTRGMEVGLEGPALYANIPIKNVKPVAPQGENGEEEFLMTDEQADEVAEEILNQIEEAAKAKAKEEVENTESRIDETVRETAKQIEEESQKMTDEVFGETKLDELHQFASNEIQAVRAELNLPEKDSVEVAHEENEVEKVAEVQENKTVTKKKTTTRKTASKKKKEE